MYKESLRRSRGGRRTQAVLVRWSVVTITVFFFSYDKSDLVVDDRLNAGCWDWRGSLFQVGLGGGPRGGAGGRLE